MFCTKCGRQLLETAKFCTGCGKPQGGDTAAREVEVKLPPDAGATLGRTAARPGEVGLPPPTAGSSAQVSAVPDESQQHQKADVIDFEAVVVDNRPSGRRSRNLVIAGVIGVLVVVTGLTGYALSRRTGISSGASAGAAPLLKGTIWDQLAPQELAAAQHALDQRIADEEREAATRLSRTTQ